MYNNGDVVKFNGQRCVVTKRDSMTLSNGGALHRYNLRGEYGTFMDILEQELTPWEGD